MKTFIITWKQKVLQCNGRPYPGHWGIGDLLRGACAAADVCEELGYKLYLDMRHHPLGKLFKHKTHGHEEYIDANKDTICMAPLTTRANVVSYLRHVFSDADVGFSAMWAGLYIFEKPLSEKTKEFIREALAPTDEYKAYLDAHLPKYDYHISHFRMGDEHMKSSSFTISHKIEAYLNEDVSGNDILLSDSIGFKNTVQQRYHGKYHILTAEPSHVGTETDIEKLKPTVLEFIAASHAKSIKTYTKYEWTSGFINTVHMIYDVPIVIRT